MAQATSHIVLTADQITSLAGAIVAVIGTLAGAVLGIYGSLFMSERENGRRRRAAATILLADLRYLDHTLRTLSKLEVLPRQRLALMPVASIHDLPPDASLFAPQTLEYRTMLRRSFLSLIEDVGNRAGRDDDDVLLDVKRRASLVLNRMPSVVERLRAEGGTVLASSQQLTVGDEPLPLPADPFS